MKTTLLAISLVLTAALFGQKEDTVDLKSHFGEFEGAFCVYDLQTDSYIRYNPKRCKQRFSPCSTFKITNSLIGLETGVITDTSFVIGYDANLHPKDSVLLANEPFKFWYQDLSLKQAFKYSCLWYYQELARRIGPERMAQKLAALKYGNGDMSGGIDQFWLCSTLQISIDEQIDFLKRLYLHKLEGISDKSMNEVKSIMWYETSPHYSLYGKTGGGGCWDGKTIGWYVGFVETSTGTKLFAMNVIVTSFKDLGNNFRITLTKNVLRELKMIQ